MESRIGLHDIGSLGMNTVLLFLVLLIVASIAVAAVSGVLPVLQRFENFVFRSEMIVQPKAQNLIFVANA